MPPTTTPVFVLQIDLGTGTTELVHHGKYALGTPTDNVAKRLYDGNVIGAGLFLVGEISARPVAHPVGQMITIRDDGSIISGIGSLGPRLTSWPPKP